MNITLKNKYILPSPAGAFYSISSDETEAAKQFLQKLMTANQTFRIDDSELGHISSNATTDFDLLLQHMQKLKWLQQFDNPIQIPDGTIEEVLPKILQQLSSDTKALLADNQGLYLASTGFTHEASEELSALSGDLSSLYSRHQGIIKGNLNIKSSAFSLVDAAGYSQLGFWPIHIGSTMFMLVISGVPRFDQAAFINLIWLLHKNYFIDEVSGDSDAA